VEHRTAGSGQICQQCHSFETLSLNNPDLLQEAISINPIIQEATTKAQTKQKRKEALLKEIAAL